MPLGNLHCEGKVTKYGTTLDYLVVTNDGRSFSFPFRHEIIVDPNPQNSSTGNTSTTPSSGTGGTSSSSGSGGSSTLPSSTGNTTPTANCKSVPGPPVFNITWGDAGVLVNLTTSNAIGTYFSYTTFDSVLAKWESWSEPNLFLGTQVFRPITGKSYIAFSATSYNACGISVSVRESVEKMGVPLTIFKPQELAILPFYIDGKMIPNSILDFSKAITSNISSDKMKVEIKSNTPFVCITDNSVQVKLLATGMCRLSIKSSSYLQFGSVTEYPYEFNVKRTDAQLNITQPPAVQITEKSITLFKSTNVSSPKFQFELSSPEVCWASQIEDEIFIDLLSIGKCEFGVIIRESTEFAATDKIQVQFLVQAVKGKISIMCLKGKSVKKVTGLSPKCPAGYKVKK
jgi:hypothetical protein